MTDEIAAISVGLSVGLGSLDRDMAKVKKQVHEVEGDHVINFVVGKVDTAAVQRQLKELSRNALPVPLNVTVARGSATALRRDLIAQLNAGGPIPIKVKANLSVTEVNRIRSEISQRLGGVSVNLRGGGGGGGGGGGAGASAPITPHERRVADDLAAKVGRAVRAPATSHAAPAGPIPASQSVAPPPAAQRASTAPRRAPTRSAPAETAPAGAAPAYVNAEDVTRPSSGSLAARLRRKAEKALGRRVSPDELRAQKNRVDRPETPEEIEYASRPARVSLPGDAQTEFEQEKRGRGVRGAGRSGARLPNEPVLLPADYEARDIQQTDLDTRISAERNKAVRAPARKSAAFYGSRTAGSPLNRVLDKLQFYKFDPVLGQAFEALSGGDEAKARQILTGFSSKLAGVDPRQRKKFFRLFRNVENVPPELLEKDAALRALFAAIHQKVDPGFTNVPSATTLRFGSASSAPKPTTTRRQKSAIDRAIEELNSGKISREEFQRRFPHLASGGRVYGERGSLPVFGRGLKGIKPEDFGEIGDTFTSLYGFPYQLRRVPISQIKPSHGVAEGRVAEYGQMAGVAPPIILGPRGIVQDGHHRLETAIRAGAKDILAYVFSGKESDLPPQLLKKLGIGHRAGGGPIRVKPGGLMARLAERGIPLPDNAVVVGEKGEEVFVPDQNGHIIDNAGQNLPMWLRRAREGKGLAKDLTHRAEGGPVRGNIGGHFRAFVPGEKEALTGGLLSRATAASVQRVFVVNWPAAASSFASVPRGAGFAAGPLRFGTDKDAEKFAKELGGHIGKQLKDLLPGTEEVRKPKQPQAETAKRPTLSPQEQLEARLGALQGETARDLRNRVLAIRSSVSETQQQLPVRSLAPAFGQISATVFGGRGEALARLSKARDLTDQASRAAGIYVGELKKLHDLESSLDKVEDPQKKAELAKQIENQAEATRSAGAFASDLAGQAETAAKAADSLGLKMRVLAANTVGIIGGTLAFGATLGVAQAALSGVQQVMTPLIDRATGFKGVEAELTKQLGEQARAQQGAIQTTVAQREAQAGLSDELAKAITPLLQQRAIVEGGNAAFADQLNLLRSARNIRQEDLLGAAGAPTGPFQPAGGVPGITRSIGGFLGSPIGATPSLFEQISNEAGQSPLQQGIRGLAETLFGPNNTVAGALGAGEVKSPQEIAQIVQDQLKNPNGPDLTAIAQAAGPALAVSDSLNAMKTGLDKVDSKFQIVGSNSERWSAEIQKASNFTLALNGVSKDLIASFDKLGGFAVINRETGKAITTPEEFKQAFNDALKSATIPDVKELVQQLTERTIPAQRALFRAEGGFQRGSVLPGQFALQQLANPTPGLTGGPGFGAGLVGAQNGKIDKLAQAAADKYRTLVGGAIKDVNAQIDAGHQALLDLVPSNERQQFSGILDDITKTGQQIASIQTDIQQQQVNVQLAQYNNELRIARRSLQDAKDLEAGLAGETRNTLGGIEGQNILLQRQLQLLGFELQQRQINFRLATAGFVSPGETPEEIAARIEEAKKEAEFAQKQLDIQKQLAANEFKGIHITADRNVTDILAQISLLEQGKQVTVNTAAAQRALDILNKKQQLLVQQAGTYIQEGVQITQAAMQAAAQVEQQTGKDFAFILTETAHAWGIFGKQAQMILDALTGTAPVGSGGSFKQPGGKYVAANGIVGDTLGPTDITVGEAAGEKVAILRNPKLVPSSTLAPMGYLGGPTGSSGGVNLTIIVTGNDIKDNASIDKLVRTIEDRVEERLMRKTSLFGLRRF